MFHRSGQMSVGPFRLVFSHIPPASFFPFPLFTLFPTCGECSWKFSFLVFPPTVDSYIRRVIKAFYWWEVYRTFFPFPLPSFLFPSPHTFARVRRSHQRPSCPYPSRSCSFPPLLIVLPQVAFRLRVLHGTPSRSHISPPPFSLFSFFEDFTGFMFLIADAGVAAGVALAFLFTFLRGFFLRFSCADPTQINHRVRWPPPPSPPCRLHHESGISETESTPFSSFSL